MLMDRISQKNKNSEKSQLQKQWGIRYSELLRLGPYFNIARNHVIDPMHNLLLGTAKNMMAVWKDQSLICLLFNAANHRCNSCTCTYWPNSPYKIHSNLTSLNADQWKIWILEYSIFAIYSGLLFSCPAYVLVTN